VPTKAVELKVETIEEPVQSAVFEVSEKEIVPVSSKKMHKVKSDPSPTLKKEVSTGEKARDTAQ